MLPHAPQAPRAPRQEQGRQLYFALRALPLAFLLAGLCALPFIARSNAAEASDQRSEGSSHSSATTHHSSRYSWLAGDADIFNKIFAGKSARTATLLPSLLIPNSTPQIIDFAGYTGAGFQPTPTAGQLDSDDWAATGWSDGALVFGGTRTTASTDYTRGATNTPESIGGFYAYTGSPHSAANPAFMIQPGGSDWAPGTLTLRLQNTGATNITQLQIAYDLYNRNDQGRSNSFNFSHSSDDTTYTNVAALNYTSTEAADALGWVQVGSSPSRSTTISGLNIAPGGFYYIRWSGADVGGSGSRDEFGLDNISVTATFALAPPSIQKLFQNSSIYVGGQTLMTISVTNPNSGTSLTGVGWSDTLPTGLSYNGDSGPDPVCGGSLTKSGATMTLTGATIAPSDACVIAVAVIANGAATGTLTNTTSAVTSTNGGTGNSASAQITVNQVLKYRSKQTGNWNDFNTWETSADGTTWSPASSTPTSADDTITILTGHIVTVTASVSADQLTVNSGGTLNVNSGVTLTIDNGPDSNDLIINGTANVGATGVIAGVDPVAVNGTLGVASANATDGLSANVTAPVTLNLTNPGGSTVDFNGTGSQTVGPRQFYNLTVSGDRGGAAVTFAGTVQIAHLFSPTATNVSYVLTGNTIEYNGSDTLTILGANFNNYYNLKLNRQSIVGFPGLTVTNTAEVVSGTFSSASDYHHVVIDSGATLSLSADNTVSGDWTNNGTFTHNGNRVTFDGSGAQTITTGGTTSGKDFGPVTINKSGGSTATLAGDFKDTSLTITTGTFDQGASFSLVSGAVSVAGGATWKDIGTGDITLSGGVTNSGTININGLTAACGETQEITIGSSGGQQPWSGTGNFIIKDVHVSNQGGTALIHVENGANDGGNGPNWLFTPGTCSGGTVYTWAPVAPGTDTNYQNPLNWDPDRTSPHPADVLVVDGLSNTTLSNIPSETIARFRFINSTTATLTTSASNTLTIAGDGTAVTDFDVAGSSQVKLSGSNTLTISIATGGTGNIDNLLSFDGTGGSRLVAADTGAVTFPNATTCTALAGYTGNPFGTNALGAGAGSIVFQSGSTYTHQSGDSPFGAAADSQIVNFMSGSNARWFTNSGFQANNRIYADLEIGSGSTEIDLTDGGSGNFQFNNLTVNNTSSQDSSLTFNGSGTNTVTIQGNIRSTGAGIGAAATTANVSLTAGSGGIQINNPGGVTFDNAGNSRSILFGSDATVASTTNLTLGRIIQNDFLVPNAVLIVNGSITPNSSAPGYIVGSVRRIFAGPGPANFTFDVGTPTGYAPVEARNTSNAGNLTVRARSGKLPAISGTNALQRYWNLSGSGITTDLTFHYLDGDVVGNEALYQVFKFDGAFTQPPNQSVNTGANTATVTGVSSFSDWTLAEPAAVEEGTLEFSAANFNDNETDADHAATITVTRTGGTDGAVSVQWATSAGTASAGTDYIEASGVLNWADNESGSKTFTVTVKGDNDSEPDETVTLTLSGATGGATISGTNPATLTIQDDDNTSPTITATTGLIRQRGSGAINSQIATVNDAETAPGSLTVTVLSAPTGILVTNIVNTNGTITAAVEAACSAATGDNTVVLQVSDGTLTDTDNLVINVTANTAPTLTYTSPQTVTEGNSLTINPATGPSDNVSVSTIVVNSPGTYTGGISVDNSTGVVRITNAAPVGDHTITIRATDNCGDQTDAQFTLTVSAAVCAAPVANLLAWYPGDGNANDIQGPTFENGTLQNGATFGPGKVNQGFSFDGSNDYVETTDFVDLNTSGDEITIEGWIKRITSGSGGMGIASKYVNATDSGWFFRFYDDKLNWGTVNAGTYNQWYSSATFTDTTSFHHVALVWKAGNASSLHVYVDGAEVTGTFTAGDGTLVPPDTSQNVLIGTLIPGADVMNGVIDGLGIYNRALAQAEIAAIYNASFAGKCRTCTTPPTGMVSWWPFDETGGTTISDIAGPNDGGTVSGATFTTGKVGNALDFNGSSDNVVVPGSPSLNSTTTALTVDAWVYWRGHLSPSDTVDRIHGKRLGAGNVSHHLVIVNNILHFGVNIGVAGGDNAVDPNPFPTNRWVHVTGTYDGTTVRLFKDGVEVASNILTTGPIQFDNGALAIGWYDDTFPDHWNGLIDEFEIFNSVLSPTQIAALANAGNAGKCHTTAVTVDVAPSSATEDGAGNLVYTFRRSGDITTDVTVNFSVGGTASSGSDYTQTGATTYDSPTGQGTIDFLANEDTKTVTIDPTPDTTVESDETVVLTVTSGAGYVVGSPDNATGTITNDDATLTLVKTVINNNGGTKVVSDFPLFIDGNAVTSGTATGVSANVVHTASETTQTGYAPSAWGGDCAADGTITLVPGDNKTCTITNDDVAPTLTLIKTVVNDSGGSKVVTDFPLFINGNGVTSGTPNTLTANVLYTASETTQTSYAPSVWGGHCAADGTITLQPGDNKTCTITNDDIPPAISINDVTHAEAHSGTVSYDFTVSLSYSSTQTITVNYQTADDSATAADADYTAVPSTGITFNPGETSKQVTIQVNGDTKFETDEQFFVNLSGAVNATIGDGQGAGTITNDDPVPTISINDVTAFEGDTGPTDFNFTVSLSNPSYQTITVTAQTANGTATTANSDYNGVGPTIVTFSPGATSQPFQVQVNGDTAYEHNEAFVVNLTLPSNATIADASGSGTITNDDAAPALSINDLAIAEGTTAVPPLTKAFNFTVTKLGSTNEQATVAYQTANDSAGSNPATSGADCSTAGVDYIASSGNVTFPASGTGSTSQIITILICRDNVFETNETFLVNLSGQVDATIADGQAVGTINNDDVPSGGFVVNTTADTIDDNLCLPVGSGNGCTLREAINAANASPSNTEINFAIPANDPRHFYYKDDGVPNQVTTGLVTATTVADDSSLTDEDPDWPHSWWSILPTSALPALTQQTLLHGYSQTGAVMNISATRSNAVLRIELDGSSAGPAVTGLVVSNGLSVVRGLVINRFTSHGLQSSGAVTGNFIGTDVSGTLDLGNTESGVLGANNMTIGGNIPEVANVLSGNDNHGILFTSFNSSIVQGNYIGTKADGVSALGNSGNGIHLTGGSAVFNTIGGAAAGQANTIAFNGNDGVSLADAGVGNVIRGNSIFSNGTTASHLGIELGTDGLTPNDASPDSDTGPNNLQNFPVIQSAVVGSPHLISGTLRSAPNQIFTIDLYANLTCDASGNGEGKTYLGSTTTTTDSNGLGGFRFSPATLNLSDQITATATSATNNTSEFSQCFQPRAFAAGQLQFTQTAISDAETNGGSHTVTFTVQRTGGTDRAASVTYTINDGTATVADNDYSVSSASGTLQWPNGVAADRTITITVNGDTKFEPDETLQIVLSNAVGASIAGPDTATLTITNEDTQPTISINDVTLNEGNAGTTNFNFTVSLSNLSYQTITVNAQTAAGPVVTANSDYNSVGSTTLTFTPNTSAQTFQVQVNGDTAFESDETFFVNLSGATNATIADNQGLGTITNDDVCVPPSTVYVDDDWAGTTIGVDPDGAGPATAFGCDSFATIQGGIDGVQTGGTVIVDDGTYTENLTLPKQVTLQGSQFGVSACGRSATEAIVTAASGTLLTLQAGSAGAVIDGFTFSGGARGIESAGGPLDNLQIRNNRVLGFTGNGIFLNDPGTDITVHQNSIDGASKTGFGGLFHLDEDSFLGFHFTSNCITGKGATDTSTGFVVDGNHNVGVSTRTPLISGNTIINAQTGMNLGRFAFTGAASTNNGTISNNTFSNNQFDGLQGGIQNTTISGNTFSGNGRHGLALTGFSALISADPSSGAINTMVLSNTITGNGFVNAGAGISFNAFQFPGTIATNEAHFNRIVGNATGAFYNGVETISLEKNWWGCNYGPGVGGAGCTGTPNGLGGTGAATLDANPWIVLGVTASPSSVTPGGSSTITADMTDTSAGPDNVTTVPLPDAQFTATNGTISPSSDAFSAGLADATFTSTSNNAGSACAAVDGQQTCATISITLPSFSINDVSMAEGNAGTTNFTFTVTKTGAGAASVSFATQDGTAKDDNPASEDNDYQPSGGSLTFASSDTTKTITVVVNGDTTAEISETFNVVLSSPTDATISDATGVGTILNDDESVSAGQLIISEFRLSGPGPSASPEPVPEANDEFIELYNNTDQALLVTTTDGSAGWAVATSSGVEVFNVPNGTIIPARGHFLGTNTTGYSLSNYPAGAGSFATGNATWTTDVPDNTALAVFRTNNTANFNTTNRLDAVGPNTESNTLFREGAGYLPLAPADLAQSLEHTFFRQICTSQGGCPTPGRPRDTQDNAADFIFADTMSTDTAAGQRLGSPGPENLASPIKRDPAVNLLLLDATVSDGAAPNRDRDTTSDAANASQFGTMTIRRRVVNQTGAAITRLRFRVIDMSTHPSGVFADLRLRSSSNQEINSINDPNTCASTGAPNTPSCTVNVTGLTLEQPPTVPATNGGGLNTTVTLPSGLPAGQSVNVNFLLGVQKTGQFKFYLVIEALP